jgi:hypothetical protein
LSRLKTKHKELFVWLKSRVISRFERKLTEVNDDPQSQA